MVVVLILIFNFLNLYAESQASESCVNILDKMDKLYELKKYKEEGNYENYERVLVGLTGTFYLGDRRDKRTKMDIDKKIKALKAKIPNCW